VPRQPISTLFPYTTLFRSELLPLDNVDFTAVAELLPMLCVLSRNCPSTEKTSDLRPWTLDLRPRQVSGIFRPQNASLAKSNRDRSEEHTSELQSRENLVCR